jgi:hypothetical protein
MLFIDPTSGQAEAVRMQMRAVVVRDGFVGVAVDLDVPDARRGGDTRPSPSIIRTIIWHHRITPDRIDPDQVIAGEQRAGLVL